MRTSSLPAPKRILMTADTVGGVWPHALNLAAALPSTEFAVMTMGRPLADEQRSAAGRLENVTVFETPYRTEWMDDPWAEVDEAGEQLLELEAMLAPDIVQLNGYAHGALPWRGPVLIVAHSCVFSWWAAVLGEPAPAARYRTYRDRVREGLCCAGAVVAPTRAMLAALEQHYAPPREATVVYNGLPACGEPPRPKQRLIIAAGCLGDEGKNFRVLDRAARGLEWPVAIAGERGEAHQVFENLEELGALPREAVLDRLASAAIFAHPARHEPFGWSVLEAAQRGCALVLSDIPSLRELWDGAAVFVCPDDVQQWHETLARLAAIPERVADLARRARQRAARYSSEAMAEGYLGVYGALMAVPKGGAAAR